MNNNNTLYKQHHHYLTSTFQSLIYNMMEKEAEKMYHEPDYFLQFLQTYIKENLSNLSPKICVEQDNELFFEKVIITYDSIEPLIKEIWQNMQADNYFLQKVHEKRDQQRLTRCVSELENNQDIGILVELLTEIRDEFLLQLKSGDIKNNDDYSYIRYNGYRSFDDYSFSQFKLNSGIHKHLENIEKNKLFNNITAFDFLSNPLQDVLGPIPFEQRENFLIHLSDALFCAAISDKQINAFNFLTDHFSLTCFNEEHINIVIRNDVISIIENIYEKNYDLTFSNHYALYLSAFYDLDHISKYLISIGLQPKNVDSRLKNSDPEKLQYLYNLETEVRIIDFAHNLENKLNNKIEQRTTQKIKI